MVLIDYISTFAIKKSSYLPENKIDIYSHRKRVEMICYLARAAYDHTFFK